MSATLRELVALWLSRPTPEATPAVVAAWYERKSSVLEHIAADGGPDANQAHRQAVQAHHHAQQVVNGTAA